MSSYLIFTVWFLFTNINQCCFLVHLPVGCNLCCQVHLPHLHHAGSWQGVNTFSQVSIGAVFLNQSKEFPGAHCSNILTHWYPLTQWCGKSLLVCVWRMILELKPRWKSTLIARFMGPTWGLPGADRTQVGPMWASWTLLSGQFHQIYASLWCSDLRIKTP